MTTADPAFFKRDSIDYSPLYKTAFAFNLACRGRPVKSKLTLNRPVSVLPEISQFWLSDSGAAEWLLRFVYSL